MSTPQGLSSATARQRLAEDGPNALPDGGHRGWLRIALETGREPMFLLLLAAGALYLLLGELQEGLILFACVLATLGLTLYQEGRTERAIAALRDLTSPRALVIRDGSPQRIAGAAIVRGDVLVLAEGDRVAADALLLSTRNLQIDESLLTGEAMPVEKAVAASLNTATRTTTTSTMTSTMITISSPPAAAYADHEIATASATQQHVYSGTLVVQGQGLACVTATGAHSEIGRIGAALNALQAESSPLQKQTARLVRTLALLAFSLSVATVILYGLMRGDWLQALLAGIALAMAMLPEEYPVVLTVFPALGAWRLSRQKVLTRRLSAIETLGATSVLCVDKTGTLTENRMSVARLYVPGHSLAVHETDRNALPEIFHPLLEFAILASETAPFDPMEQAFHRLGLRVLSGSEHLHHDWVLVHDYELTPQLRAMSHIWQRVDGGDHVVAAKGAPEAVFDLCHLDTVTQAGWVAAVDAMAAEGLRVLAVAQARYSGAAWPQAVHEFTFELVGLIGLADPLRTEIPAAIRECREAGIRVIMITGDYPATAASIAQAAGLDAQVVLSGDTLATLSDSALRARLHGVSVCARITPTQKLRIVQALKADGYITAMTGDGVNDAPALKAAHVGIAMGGRGTDVAREAASLVLVDDNFSAIVSAIRLGRRIFDNLRKSMSYILAVHVPIAGTALIPVLLGWPAVLFPVHIAFLELIIDPACSLAFENEAAEADVMQRPPRDPEAALFGRATIVHALLQGGGVLLLVTLAQLWGNQHLDEAAARACAFVTLVTANLSLIFANRSPAVFWRAPANRVAWMVTALTLGLLALALYVPAIAGVFRLAPLAADALAAATALGLLTLLWCEMLKRLQKRSP